MLENKLLSGIESIEFSQFKHLANFDKLKELSQGNDVFPVTVEIDPVAFCNHSCNWCVDPKHSNLTLEKEFIFNLLEELKELGVKGIVFKGGGEPTLHPNFAAIVSKAKELGFETGLVTNGSRLSEFYDAIAENLSYVRVSIDGPKKEIHERIHNSKDFDVIVAGAKKLLEVRKQKGKRHPIIGFSFAMDYSSKDNIWDAIILGDSLGADYVLFRTPFFEEVGRKPTMTSEQSFELKKEFQKKAKEYSGKMKIFVDFWVSDKEAALLEGNLSDSPRRGSTALKGFNGIEHITKECNASPLLAIVSADKNVYPCCNLRLLEEWSVGKLDFEKGNNFKKVWESNERKKIIGKLHRTDCIKYCTHPLSKYNEIIEYLKSPKYHGGFV